MISTRTSRLVQIRKERRALDKLKKKSEKKLVNSTYKQMDEFDRSIGNLDSEVITKVYDDSDSDKDSEVDYVLKRRDSTHRFFSQPKSGTYTTAEDRTSRQLLKKEKIQLEQLKEKKRYFNSLSKRDIFRSIMMDTENQRSKALLHGTAEELRPVSGRTLERTMTELAGVEVTKAHSMPHTPRETISPREHEPMLEAQLVPDTLDAIFPATEVAKRTQRIRSVSSFSRASFNDNLKDVALRRPSLFGFIQDEGGEMSTTSFSMASPSIATNNHFQASPNDTKPKLSPTKRSKRKKKRLSTAPKSLGPNIEDNLLLVDGPDHERFAKSTRVVFMDYDLEGKYDEKANKFKGELQDLSDNFITAFAKKPLGEPIALGMEAPKLSVDSTLVPQRQRREFTELDAFLLPSQDVVNKDSVYDHPKKFSVVPVGRNVVFDDFKKESDKRLGATFTKKMERGHDHHRQMLLTARKVYNEDEERKKEKQAKLHRVLRKRMQLKTLNSFKEAMDRNEPFAMRQAQKIVELREEPIEVTEYVRDIEAENSVNALDLWSDSSDEDL
ncbi:hypothetical protein PCE1_004293 [Barthelona sp. PCE]